MNKTISEKLIEYSKNGRYPLHMPGHKRNVHLLKNQDIYDIDITEIDGFDNLHYAKGIIRETMDRAAQFYGTKKIWFLVNGSTCGIHAAISAVTKIGDKILIGRNCHKSVYHAVELRNLKAEYIYPEIVGEYGIYGGYSPEKIERILEKNSEIKVVVLTSPTYEGMVSDIQIIAEIVHQKKGILIVDEAHGAHFGLSDQMPKPAYQCGADIVIESLHKTLPAMTQTAVMHLMGERVNEQEIEHFLDIYETSSPSYVMMTSIDDCISGLCESGRQKMEQLYLQMKSLRNNAKKFKNIRIPGKELVGKYQIYDIDETKLVFDVGRANITGKMLAERLRNQYAFEPEMEGLTYVLAICTICDDKEQLERLFDALEEIDTTLTMKDRDTLTREIDEKIKISDNGHLSGMQDEDIFGRNNFQKIMIHQESIYTIYEAGKKDKEQVDIVKASGKISAEFAYLYPPGIPMIVPGEMISDDFISWAERIKKNGLIINGLDDAGCRQIMVVKE